VSANDSHVTQRVSEPVPGMDQAPTILAFLFATGPSVALAAIAATSPSQLGDATILGLLAGSYAVAAIAFLARGVAEQWSLQVGVAIGTVLITLGILQAHGFTSPFAFFYVWVVVYAFYFFPRWAALVQFALVGVGYALVPAEDHMLWWFVTMGTLGASGVAIMMVKGRVFELVERLEQLSRTDPLTGLLNRRGYREALDRELERARRHDEPLALAVGDLDHFKQVNDVHGHDAGDLALSRAAAVLTKSMRAIDVAARTGGEEFALLLPGTDPPRALEVTARLREAMRREFRSGPQLSISFGIATFPDHGHTARSLMGAADRSLYRAKQLGRDRAVVAAADGETGLHNGATRGPAPEHLARMLALAEAAEIRNPVGVTHSQIVAAYAEMIARELGLGESKVERIRVAALLHDVGKIYVSERILKKPGKLTAQEWEQIRKHVELSARLVEHDDLADIREWIRAHHERPDGTGYPRGLKGEEIPLESRIIAVADAYEAMTNKRPYSPAKTALVAQREMRLLAGTQFDPRVVDAFLKALGASSRSREGVAADQQPAAETPAASAV
jgi:diguanylate cyclase (GGDEF)-like protein/putative nucleotidyltransferase with HDIG domain